MTVLNIFLCLKSDVLRHHNNLRSLFSGKIRINMAVLSSADFVISTTWGSHKITVTVIPNANRCSTSY